MRVVGLVLRFEPRLEGSILFKLFGGADGPNPAVRLPVRDYKVASLASVVIEKSEIHDQGRRKRPHGFRDFL